MLTLRLNDATEVKISDDGFIDSVVKINDITTNAVSFTTQGLVVSAVREFFNDTKKTAKMQVIDSHKSVMSTVNGYTELLSVSVCLSTDGESYIVTMAQPTDIESIKNEMKSALRSMKESNKTITGSVNELSEKIDRNSHDISLQLENTNTAINHIQEAIAPPNPDSMSLEELKKFYVEKSKKELEKWLIEHPMTSSVHGGKEAIYSVTAEKQVLLQYAIMVAQMQKAAKNDAYKVCWNASGDLLEDNWTIEELSALALEINEYVRPYVIEQQMKETEIMEAVSIDVVKNVNMSYDVVPMKLK